MLIQEADVEVLQQRDLTTSKVNMESCSMAAVLGSLRSSTIKAYQSISLKFINATNAHSSTSHRLLLLLGSNNEYFGLCRTLVF